MKKETLEEATERYIAEDNKNRYYYDFIAGAKWQQERSYSEEDMINFSKYCFKKSFTNKGTDLTIEDLFEQFKKK